MMKMVVVTTVAVQEMYLAFGSANAVIAQTIRWALLLNGCGVWKRWIGV